MSNKDVLPERDLRIPARQRGLHKRIAELEAENAKLKVLESLVLELVEDYTITDKRVRAALKG